MVKDFSGRAVAYEEEQEVAYQARAECSSVARVCNCEICCQGSIEALPTLNKS